MRWLTYLALLVVVVMIIAAGAAVYMWRRALPEISGTVTAPQLRGPVEIVRDRWGIPHIFAESDADAYHALGWVMVQDRLFQMDLLRHVSQGRLAELMGKPVVDIDVRFRTLDLRGIGLRMYERTRPEVQSAVRSFTAGANAALEQLGSNLPPEYSVLRTRPARFRADDFVSLVGFMTWGLNPGWRKDPIYERIVSKVGPRRTAELFPQELRGPLRLSDATQGNPGNDAEAGWKPLPGNLLRPSRLQVSAESEALLSGLPSLKASNGFVVGPRRSATGAPILANDPHLGLGLPGTWYLAHLRTPTQDVMGYFVPGVPFAVVGRNRDISWGMVNANLDGGDFFVEKIDPQSRELVLHEGQWIPLRKRNETIRVKGGDTVDLTVLETPRGPLVHDLLEGQDEVLSYRWVYAAAEDANEIEAFYDLNRARNWNTFRAALRRFGATAQQVTYADRSGHIGLQMSGRIPRRSGPSSGMRFRVGWSGTEDWLGFWPFEKNPSLLDPAEGIVIAANNAPDRAPPFHLSAYYEPEDRILRLRELLAQKGRHSVEDVQRIQTDTLFVTGRALAPRIAAAFDESPPAEDALRAAVRLLQNWDGNMAMDSAGAAVFAAFYKHLFPEIFADELGDDLIDDLRRGNQSAVMMHAVLLGGREHWFDRVDSAQGEDRTVIFRSALRKAVAELTRLLGEDPNDWQWGKLHQVLLRHPLGRVAFLGLVLNEGPHPMPGHAQTVFKAQFQDSNYQVYFGPSMRQIVNMGSPAQAFGVLPSGQSGLPASPHYTDLTALWREGRYLPLLMDREDIDRVSEGRSVLKP